MDGVGSSGCTNEVLGHHYISEVCIRAVFVEFPSRRDAAEPYVDAMMSRTINTPSSSLQAVGKPPSRGPPFVASVSCLL